MADLMNSSKIKLQVSVITSVCIIIFLFVFTGCSSGSSANDGSNSNSGSPLNPPMLTGTFDITNITISPEKIFIGETATISVTLHNGGGCEDTQDIELYLNGALEDQQRVDLDDEETETISFDVVKNEYNRYWVGIEDLGELDLGVYLYIWPLGPVPDEHGDGPFCSECH